VLGCLAVNDDAYVECNVRQRSIADLWNDPSAFAYARHFKAGAAGPNCAGCAKLAVCKGGCAEMSLMKTGKPNNDPYCFYKIERKLFAEELNNPLKRLRFRLNGFAASARSFERLGRAFFGKR
jgi:radical SAM protein with 4Fe4S-binding SPASM domain